MVGEKGKLKTSSFVGIYPNLEASGKASQKGDACP